MQEQKTEARKPEKKEERESFESLIRILGYDIPGTKNIFTGLTRIKGISWAVSNAVCTSLGIDKSKKVSELSKDELKKIESYIQEMSIPEFLKNRRLDPETGKTSHLIGSDLQIKTEFDIKRMKKIRSYKGIRHTLKLPVRGQRTRSHFRTKGRRAVGVIKKSAAKTAAKPKEK